MIWQKIWNAFWISIEWISTSKFQCFLFVQIFLSYISVRIHTHRVYNTIEIPWFVFQKIIKTPLKTIYAHTIPLFFYSLNESSLELVMNGCSLQLSEMVCRNGFLRPFFPVKDKYFLRSKRRDRAWKYKYWLHFVIFTEQTYLYIYIKKSEMRYVNFLRVHSICLGK